MDKSKIQSITRKSASYNKVLDNWTLYDNTTEGDCRTIELLMEGGNKRLFVVDSVLVYPSQRLAIISIKQLVKMPEDDLFIQINKPSEIFHDDEMIISDDYFCSATDPNMTAIPDRTITHNDIGELNTGYITLWDAYKNNIGNPALFTPAQEAAYGRIDFFKNS